jgi:hypothetical protein
MDTVRQVDHVLLHSDAPEALFETLSETLGLPVVSPFRPQGTFASGLVCAGNANLEAVRLGPPSSAPAGSARLFGIAFEPAAPISNVIDELDARGVGHSAPAPYPHDGEMRRWTNVGVEGMVPGALIFLCEYAHDVASERANMRAALQARDGGPLGIQSLRMIEIETQDVTAAAARWDALLLPGLSPERGTWICGEGPAVRIVRGSFDAITSLTFDVRSMRDARAFLEDEGMFGGDCGREVRIDPHAVQGLDLRFREKGR